MALSPSAAYALIARNLAMAERQRKGGEHARRAVQPCYLNLAKTDHYMRRSRPSLDQRVNAALEAGGLHYTPGTVEVRHLLEVIVNDVGVDKVARARARGRSPVCGSRPTSAAS